MIVLSLLGEMMMGAETVGFLFATFKDEKSERGEQIYFATSRDGRKWEALNEGCPSLISEVGERGLRDPYLLRSHDGGSFYLIATDLSIFHQPDWVRAVERGSRSIAIYESKDLVDWSAPRLVEVAVEDAGCAWAPEAIYDEARGAYLVFWASTTRRDHFEKHRMWASWTRDFEHFGEAFIYVEKAGHVIDSTIAREDGGYVRFTKDETFKSILMETSANVLGPWEENTDFSLSKEVGYEGPLCFQIDSGDGQTGPTWCLMLDQYAKQGGYQPFLSRDLKSGLFEKAEGFALPFRFRHGSVLALSEEEYERVSAQGGLSE